MSQSERLPEARNGGGGDALTGRLETLQDETTSTNYDNFDFDALGTQLGVGGDGPSAPPRVSFLQGPRASSMDAAGLDYLSTMKRTQREMRMEKMRARKSLYSLSRRSEGSAGSGTSGPRARKSLFQVLTDKTPLLAAQKRSVEFLARKQPSELSKSKGSHSKSESEAAIDEEEEEEEEEIQETPAEALFNMICGKGIVSLCLLAMPFSLWAVHHGWSDTWIFWLNFIVMIPLASILGDFTEEVALHTNEVTGGLINASFGNAVEVVVAIQALLANEIRVVQASMLGSIFSNLLLVLGCCFFFGGIYHKEQTFNSISATANIGLLALSSIALVLPTPFAEYYELHDEHVLIVSRIAAFFLIFMYAQLLFFQLHTHAHIFEGADDDEELASLSLVASVTGLCVVTLMVAVFSEYLVGSIEGFTEASGISRTFVGIILLPIVGNAVEHVAAVTVSMKDKMDLAMGIAVGSCTQISLFVVPLTVLSGWVMGRDMTLNFPHFEILLYVLSVFTVSVVISTSKCNWLEGSLLVTTYCLIAVGFWFESVRDFV